MGSKSINFISKIYRKFLSFKFEIWRFIRGVEVGTKCKISAHLQNYTTYANKNTGTGGVNTTIAL